MRKSLGTTGVQYAQIYRFSLIYYIRLRSYLFY